jgi:hypothetical protein
MYRLERFLIGICVLNKDGTETGNSPDPPDLCRHIKEFALVILA